MMDVLTSAGLHQSRSRTGINARQRLVTETVLMVISYDENLFLLKLDAIPT